MIQMRRLAPWLYEGVYSKGGRELYLRSIHNLEGRTDQIFKHEYLYSCLTILDSKAQSLISFDGILLAASSIVLSTSAGASSTGVGLTIASLVISGLSSCLCLMAVWVIWTETPNFDREDELFVHLLAVRDKRTVAYRLSWVTAQFAAFILVIGAIVERVS